MFKLGAKEKAEHLELLKNQLNKCLNEKNRFLALMGKLQAEYGPGENNTQ